jgi:hypothetical protein
MTSAAWIRWENKKAVETRLRRPGERMPERDELGYDDEDDWEFGLSGEKVDPWQNTRLVYFVDPDTAEEFTYSTSSWGGRDGSSLSETRLRACARCTPTRCRSLNLRRCRG